MSKSMPVVFLLSPQMYRLPGLCLFSWCLKHMWCQGQRYYFNILKNIWCIYIVYFAPQGEAALPKTYTKHLKTIQLLLITTYRYFCTNITLTINNCCCSISVLWFLVFILLLFVTAHSNIILLFIFTAYCDRIIQNPRGLHFTTNSQWHETDGSCGS